MQNATRQDPRPIGCTGDQAGTPRPVLVVEDSKAEQMRMEAMLRGFGYEVLTADDGEQALRIVRDKRVQLVVSDWRMPRMSGIDLCRALRAPGLGEPYVILVTGRNTKSDLVAGMDAGADDYIAKPFGSEELRVRLQAGDRLLRLRELADQRNEELNAALQREASLNHAIRSDLEVAARMQREILPGSDSPLPGIEIGSLYQGANGVAGDSFGFFHLDTRFLAFFLIDVAGHGIAAAMQSFALARLLSPDSGAYRRTQTDSHPREVTRQGLPGHLARPSEVVAALNRRFCDTDDCLHYFTMVSGILDAETGTGLLCQAGHPHPLVIEGTRRVRQLGKGGFAVGMLEEAVYDDVPFHLDEGERLALYSDGITEACNPAGEPFGNQRLAKLLAHGHPMPVAELAQRTGQQLEHWRGTAPGDDVSLLLIGRKGR